MVQPVVERHVRVSAETEEIRQHPGEVDPRLREFHPEILACRLADHRLVEEGMVGHQRRLANVLQEGKQTLDRIDAGALRRAADAMDQDVGVRAHLLLAKDDLKGIVEVQSPGNQCDGTDRNQTILLHVQPARFDVDDDVTLLFMHHREISRWQPTPVLDHFLLCRRKAHPVCRTAEERFEPAHDQSW